MRSEKPTAYAERLFGILRLFSEESESLGVKEIAERLALPPSSVHRILEPLVKLELVERAPQRRYRVGIELYRIAARIENRFELISIAKPLVAELAAESGETCLLGLLTPSRSRIVLSYKIDSQLPNRFKFDLLTNITPVWGSLGRAILAWLGPADIRRALAESEPCPVTGAAVPDWATIQKDLKRIRERGVAVSHGQRAGPNAVGVSAPFFDASGNVRGGIGIVAPSSRIPQERISAIQTLIKLHARQLSRLIGRYPESVPVPAAKAAASATINLSKSPKSRGKNRECLPKPESSSPSRSVKTLRKSTSVARKKATA
jgi:DNA-binding IclR family transcriptional regulator